MRSVLRPTIRCRRPQDSKLSHMNSARTYGLRTLFSAVAVLSLLCALAVSIYTNRRDQAELAALRVEAGSLNVDDPQMVHVRYVATRDEYSWKWRLFVPPNTNVEAGVELDSAYREYGDPTGGVSRSVTSDPNGVVISVSVSPTIDGVSTVSLRLGNDVLGTFITNCDPGEWLPHDGNRYIAAETSTQKFERSVPIRLLTREKPGIWKGEGHPMAGKDMGLVVWIVPREER